MEDISMIIRLLIVLMIPTGLVMLFFNPLIGIGLMVFAFTVINLDGK